MTPITSLQEIQQLFYQRGGEQYSGEQVTQLEHALQTAFLAEQAGENDALITAALLHDLGHLLHNLGDTPSLHGVDDAHQHSAVTALRGLFDAPVLQAIALHVDAKRYLCVTDPTYLKKLSADSQRSLALQGGAFSLVQAKSFVAQAHASAAVRLRIWDDLAKSRALTTPPLTHFLNYARRCMNPTLTTELVTA